MKRKIILILVLVLVLSVFAACTPVTREKQNYESMFVIVETASTWRIVYHKETRVMYAVSNTGYNAGNFTLLVDADGNPLLWGERSEENK